MEELDFELNLDEFEVIERGLAKFHYPVAYLSPKNNTIGFNTAAKPLIPNCLKWLCNSEYIVAIPADKAEPNTFLTHNPHKRGENFTIAAFPTIMRNEKKVKPGYAKLYKFKDGFAFKRNERIEIGE